LAKLELITAMIGLTMLTQSLYSDPPLSPNTKAAHGVMAIPWNRVGSFAWSSTLIGVGWYLGGIMIEKRDRRMRDEVYVCIWAMIGGAW
jgi:hypothetical protein